MVSIRNLPLLRRAGSQGFEAVREVLPDYVEHTGSLMIKAKTAESSTAFLQSFVTLAHSLDVMVIAQQVERIEQLAVLSLAGVDAGQGYYFGSPK